ncbi:MAG TPA: M23 family metallopeptidase [Ramlibacter sp.]|jgi:murein DD-endopeptidase MepM/ murein hydrolase activator NlpD|nr:M23 family metallopeptidase [Ramlibacter sp.]
MARAAVLIALATAALLQGCDRQAVVTRVEPPRHSLPDDTVLRPQAGAPAAPPSGEASVAPAEPAPPTAAVPAAPPVAGGPLPSVRDPGDAQGAQLLAQRPLLVPVVGVPPARLADNYEQSRGARKHEAIDILAPHGTPVVAVDDGRVTKLFTSKPGGLTIYQYDPNGQLAYYYAHLQRYAPGLREGQEVKRGEVIGYVGVTGNSDPNAPHLHFGVFRLGNPPQWWKGEAVNPYPALSRAQGVEQVATR